MYHASNTAIALLDTGQLMLLHHAANCSMVVSVLLQPNYLSHCHVQIPNGMNQHTIFINQFNKAMTRRGLVLLKHPGSPTMTAYESVILAFQDHIYVIRHPNLITPTEIDGNQT